MFDINQYYKKCLYYVGIFFIDYMFYFYDCFFFIYLEIYFILRFVIKVGFVDKIFEVQFLNLDLIVNVGGIFSGVVKVVGYEFGFKMICIDLFV